MDPGGPVVAEVDNVVPLRLGGRQDLLAATDLRLGRRIAIRTLAPPVDEAAEARFEHDCRVYGMACSHPRVATLYRTGRSSDGRPYLLLELIDGIDLSDHLRRMGPMAWTEAVDLVLDLADGLGRFHRAGRFHLDLQPRTIIHGPSGLSLTDVGLIDAVPLTPIEGPGADRHLAPERRSDPTDPGLADRRTDLFSLTAVLTRMISGDDANPADPSSAGFGPAALQTFLAAGLSPDPADRPQTAEEFCRELDLVRHGRTTGQVRIPPIPLRPTGSVPFVPALANSRPVGPGPSGPTGGATDATVAIDSALPPNPTGRTDGFDLRERIPLLGAAGLVVVALIGALLALGGNDRQIGAPPLPTTGGRGVPAGAVAESSDPPIVGNAAMAGDRSMLDADGMNADPTIDGSTTTALPASTTTTRGRVQLPDLVGQDVGRAGGRLADLGLQVLVVGRVAPGSPPGVVIEQVPSGGRSVTPPLTVTLYIPRSSTLPDLVGQPVETACVRLRALGLSCDRVARFDDQAPAGTVMSTEPGAGAPITDGQAVEVVVSQGPVVDLVVPEVAGVDEAAARGLLAAAGFPVLDVAVEPSATVAQGLVIGTDPAAGTTVSADRSITIRLSSGPPAAVTIPELIGRQAAEAQAILADLGLEVVITEVDLPADDPADGLVVSSEPGTSTTVEVGSTVTIQVGRAARPDDQPSEPDPPPSTMPDP